MPMQAPTEFELVIDFKTTKALGPQCRPMLLARADKVGAGRLCPP
jgi:hypothetical protein